MLVRNKSSCTNMQIIYIEKHCESMFCTPCSCSLQTLNLRTKEPSPLLSFSDNWRNGEVHILLPTKEENTNISYHMNNIHLKCNLTYN